MEKLRRRRRNIFYTICNRNNPNNNNNKLFLLCLTWNKRRKKLTSDLNEFRLEKRARDVNKMKKDIKKLRCMKKHQRSVCNVRV